MKELVLANRAADWQRLKALVLDSVSSPITGRVYNLRLSTTPMVASASAPIVVPKNHSIA